MFEILLSIPVALLILVGCFEAGRLVLKLLRIHQMFKNPIESTILDVAIGIVTVEILVMALSFVHLLSTPVLWILFAALLISSLALGRKEIVLACRAIALTTSEFFRTPLNAVLGSIVLTALGMDLISTFTPTTAWDALTAHYAIPFRWLQAGSLIPLPDITFHELPAATEMLFASAFGLGGVGPDRSGGGVLAANHLTWATGALIVFALIAIGRRLGDSSLFKINNLKSLFDSTTPGLIASIAFLSLPITYVELMEGGFIDNFLCFLSLAFVLTLLSYKDKYNPTLLPALGVLAGGLLATKHTAFILDTFAFVALLIWILRMPLKSRPWGYLIFATLLAILIPLPWYLKSFIETGNPVYPFLSQVFNPTGNTPDVMYWSNPNVNRSILGFITWIPRLTWDESIVQIQRRLLSYYFLPMLPFSIWYGIAFPKARLAALLMWIHFLIVYLTAPGEPRYALLAWVLYASLGALGILLAFNRTKWFAKIILPLLLVIPIGWSLVQRTHELNTRIPVIIGTASVDKYFGSSLDIYLLVNYINHNTPSNSKIIMMDPRVFPLNRDYIVWYPFPTPPTSSWPDLPPEEIIKRWAESGAKYIMVSFGPNYRAIAVDKADGGCCDPAYPTPLFSSIPGWIYTRAAYAEPGIQLDNSGTAHLLPEYITRCQSFDIKSINLLEKLLNLGAIQKVFEDPKAGAVYKIYYPGDDRK
jgi:4-amino-4-deoxy-L-arabinose transferase-like glycosyltransferase